MGLIPMWRSRNEGSAVEEVDEDNPLPTQLIGPIAAGGLTALIKLIPKVSTSAYTTAYAVGPLLVFPGAARSPGGSGIIESLVLVDRSKQNVALDLVLFDQPFTATADNAAFAPSDGDMENMVGSLSLATYTSFSAQGQATLTAIGLPFVTRGQTGALYGQLVARSTPTYTRSDALILKLGILQDP